MKGADEEARSNHMTPKAWLAVLFGYGAGVWFSFLALKKRALLARAAAWLNTTGRVLESTEYKEPRQKEPTSGSVTSFMSGNGSRVRRPGSPANGFGTINSKRLLWLATYPARKSKCITIRATRRRIAWTGPIAAELS